MKKISCLLGALLLLTVNAGIASAYSFNTFSADDGYGGLTSPYAWAQVETFDSAPIFTPWTGDSEVVTGSVSGKYAAPSNNGFEDVTKYVTVPFDSSTGTATATLPPGIYNYFGLWWGSVDDYNTLTFLLGGKVVQTITGLDIAAPADGDQQDPLTNLYVNFLDLPNFDSFSMTSTKYAFEADNIAVGVVPEPGTIILLGAGLLGLGLYGRKRMKS